MANEIAPNDCLRCGSHDTALSGFNDDRWIECRRCDYGGPSAKTEAEAVEGWNAMSAAYSDSVKAPEPTGYESCRNCGKKIEPSEAHKTIGNGVFIHTESGRTYCNTAVTFAKPKAPEDIEMELPPLPTHVGQDVYEILNIREAQLESEIASNRIWRDEYLKVRVERDAALEEVQDLEEIRHEYIKITTEAQSERDQLQRDLDEAKGLLKAVQVGTKQHPTVCTPDGDFKCHWCVKVDMLRIEGGRE